MKALIKGIIITVYRKYFIKKRFYSFNRFLHSLSLNGIGILNYENEIVSGEDSFIKWLVLNKFDTKGVIFDIGANKGDYARFIRKNNSKAELFCFEPHPANFKVLDELSHELNFKAIMEGMGNVSCASHIYDYKSESGSQHASVFKDVIEKIHNSSSQAIEIQITTIDEFVEKHRINQISLLKVDTEGNELNVLLGAQRSISNNLINIIHFEFNEMNVISRTYFKDFMELLPGYTFYRLLPDGMVKLGGYNSIILEIFAFQNIIAVNREKLSKCPIKLD